jgi:molecular chaperone DnaK
MDRSAKIAVGIDLGTTFSVVARLDSTGNPRVIPNLDGDLSTPSIVYFHDGGVVVGKEAAKLARFEPAAVAQFAKRDMGKAVCHKRILGNRLPPELIQALILRQLKHDASLAVGDFEKVVITVPAYFNEPRRKATMDAARLAGMDVLDIINEPTAAALAYGVQDGFLDPAGRAKRKEQILVYDLGGGTFDATLMEIDGMKYRAVATDGDVCLGGIDWDQRIADHVATQFKAQFKVDLHQDAAAWQTLLQDSEDAKRGLSNRPKVVVHFQHDGNRLAIPLTAEQVESMTSDLVDRTIFTVKNLLRESGRQWRDLTRILLVGGSSRMPMVQAALERESGMALDRSMLAEEPVALGAAVYAGLLLNQESGEHLDMEVQNISSHHLGVLGVDRQTKIPRRKVLIPRYTPLPATGSSLFQTFRDDQHNVAVDVVEGGDDSGQNATQIGRCVVSGLPAGLPAGTRVKVTFAYATNGRLTVTAKLPKVQTQVTMVVERPTGLSEDEITKWQQWIEAGAVLEVAKPAPVGKGDPAEPPGSQAVVELRDDDLLDTEVYDEPLVADEPELPAITRGSRKGGVPKRGSTKSRPGTDMDAFFEELG